MVTIQNTNVPPSLDGGIGPRTPTRRPRRITVAEFKAKELQLQNAFEALAKAEDGLRRLASNPEGRPRFRVIALRHANEAMEVLVDAGLRGQPFPEEEQKRKAALKSRRPTRAYRRWKPETDEVRVLEMAEA